MPSLLQGSLGRTFEALKFRDFRFLWISSLSAAFAVQMQILARGWLIYDLTESELALTWVMLSFLLPSALFSLIGGVLSDRIKKKSIMLAAQCLSTVATFLFGLIIFLDAINFWHFIYFGIFNGTVMALSMPARTSILPDLVGRKSLVNAMALSSSTFNLARVAGPTAAGTLIALFAAGNTSSTQGVGLVFFVITGLHAVSIFCTYLLHYRGEPHRKTPKKVRRDLTEGFVYIRRNRTLVGLLLMGLIPMTFGFSATFLMPAFNADMLQGDSQMLGYLVASMGIGALFGSLTLARLGDVGHKGRLMFLTAYLWAIFIALFAFSGILWFALVFSALIGLFSSVMGSLNMSVVQLVVPPAMRGRMMAILWATHGLMPLGMIPIGWLAEVWSISFALLTSAILLAGSTYALRVYIPELAKIRKGYDEPSRYETSDSEVDEDKETSAKYSTVS